MRKHPVLGRIAGYVFAIVFILGRLAAYRHGGAQSCAAWAF